MNTLEVLREARGNISIPQKWLKGSWDDGYGRHCAIGAVQVALRVETGEETAEENDQVMEVKQVLNSVVGQGIEGYNDDKGTTHACVLAAFDAAIELEELRASNV